MLSVTSKAAAGTPLLPKREWRSTIFARAGALHHASDPCRHMMEPAPPALAAGTPRSDHHSAWAAPNLGVGRRPAPRELSLQACPPPQHQWRLQQVQAAA